MKTYTFEGGVLREDVKLSSDVNNRPCVKLGEQGRGRKMVLAPLPPGTTIEGREPGTRCPNHGKEGKEFLPRSGDLQPDAGECPACKVWVYSSPRHEGWLVRPSEGTLKDVPPRDQNDQNSCVLVIKDHSGFRGSWHLRGARSLEEWDDIVAERRGDSYSPERDMWNKNHPEKPHGCRIISEGWKAQGAAGYAGGGPEYLLIIPNGVTVEIVRTGRLYGAPSAIRIENNNGILTSSDPRKEAETRKVQASW